MKQCDVKGRNFTLKTVFINCVALSNQGFINWHWEPVLKQDVGCCTFTGSRTELKIEVV